MSPPPAGWTVRAVTPRGDIQHTGRRMPGNDAYDNYTTYQLKFSEFMKVWGEYGPRR